MAVAHAWAYTPAAAWKEPGIVEWDDDTRYDMPSEAMG
jgi:hypothetical protein